MQPDFRHALLFCLLLAMTFAWGGLWAQETEETPTATQEPETQPETTPELSVFDVSAQSQETAAWLREARAQLDAQIDLDALRDAIPAVEESLEVLSEDTQTDRLRVATRQTMADLRNKWSQLVGQLDSGQALISGRLEELNALSKELDNQLELWRAAQENATEVSAPAAVVERIAEMVRDEVALRDEIRDRLEDLLVLQDQITGLSLQATEQLDQVFKAEQQLQLRILRRDGAPLWALDEEDRKFSRISQQLTASKDNAIRVWRQFITTYAESIVFQFLVFALLAWFAFKMRRDIPGDAPEHPRWLATRPLSLALLCSLLLTLWLYPVLPHQVSTVVAMLAVFAMIRLIPLVAGKRVWIALALMAVIIVIQQIRHLLSFGLEERLLLLLQTVLGLGALFVIHRLYGAQLRETRIGSWGSWLIIVSLWASGVAILANVIGYVNLSRTVTEAVAGSGFVAVAAYLAVTFLRRVVDYLIAKRKQVPVGFVQQYSGRLAGFTKAVISILGVLVWLAYTLDELGLRNTAKQTWSALIESQISLGSIDFSLGQVVAFIVTMIVAVLFAKLVRLLLERELFVRIQLPRGIPNTISTLVGYVIIALGFLIAVSAAGMDLTNFGIIIGALGVGIGFGLQNIVNNFISGLILIFERPVQVGDNVQLGDMWGTVTGIGIRASTVKTFDGAEVIVPNGDLIAQQVTNWTRSDQRRRQKLPVKVAFGSDPRKVEEILIKVAEEHPETLKDPAPMALFDGTTETGMNFNLLWWVPFNAGLGARNQVAMTSHEALRDAGIAAPIPVRRVSQNPPEAG